uniref:Uncharacterized protein n=1 Tax=Leersia perrieri TaxID=77586 RepID=A0A0D9XH83_9ORYZ
MVTSLIVRRSKPELVAPSRPTPHDTKLLSDLDDLRNHYEYTPILAFFRSAAGANTNSNMPAVIRKALGEALVYFYPMAGRLRELPPSSCRKLKLAVDCTAEGVLFVAAEADLTLADLGDPLLPPFPGSGELVCDDVGDSCIVVVDKPLVFMQVTEFKCGGFSIGMQWNHCMADGFGSNQFLKAIADLARGEPRPLLLPVWERHLLMARAPPSVAAAFPTFKPLIDASYSSTDDVMLTTPLHNMVTRHFIFGRREIAALRRHLSRRHRCTDLQLLAAALWRCRTAALPYLPHRRVRVYIPMNTRGRHVHLPDGYYGNALAYSIADASAGDLCGGELGDAVDLVSEARLRVTEEYVRSTVDLMAASTRAMVFDGVYVVSDLTRLFTGEDMDFGQGREWVVSGMAHPMLASFLVRCRINNDGEDAVAASMVLPPAVMDRFAEELHGLLLITGEHHDINVGRNNITARTSSRM